MTLPDMDARSLCTSWPSPAAWHKPVPVSSNATTQDKHLIFYSFPNDRVKRIGGEQMPPAGTTIVD
jgi:hypothetical protein